MAVSTLLQWFGSDRMMAKQIGSYFANCKFFMSPFCGGMSILPHVDFRTAVISDLHWHVVNLAEVVRDRESREWLVGELEKTVFHPAILRTAQAWLSARETCSDVDLNASRASNQIAAYYYFISCWMGRAACAGTKKEFDASFAIRYDAAGGDSALRFRNATNVLEDFGEIFQRCQFACEDFENLVAERFIKNEGEGDSAGRGLYIDAPWPDDGNGYKFGFSESDHIRLRDLVSGIQNATVVVRYNNHELIQELYPKDEWDWRFADGRTQSNNVKREVHITRNVSLAETTN